MPSHADPALDTLLLPFTDGRLAWPRDGAPAGNALFLRGRDGAALHAASRPGLVAAQPFKPLADALAHAGVPLLDSDVDDGRRWPLVLLLPPRQRAEARAWFARALDRVAPGGVVVACQPNDEGAKSGQADFARVAGPLQVLSKHHCRVYWTAPWQAPADATLLAEWRALDAPRPILDGRWISRPGVFAWDRVDAGSALLAAHLPADLAGDAADLGAGWGYLASVLAERCPALRALDLYEADARALALARTTLGSFQHRLPFAI